MTGARVIGLTGGIASGKSTVAAELRDLGAPIVDADQLAREVVEPGTPALAEIERAFGPEVLDTDGRLDRRRMGEIVFADPDARRTLNAIVHPRIAEAGQEAVAAHAAAGARIVIYEAALIVENGLHHALDGLVVVAAPEDVQIERLIAREGLDEESARARVAAQLPLADKIAVADHVIDNSGSPARTREQVRQVWDRLERELEKG